MKRLEYKEAMEILYEAMESGRYYWRIQSNIYNGVIPTGHKSHERMFGPDGPQHIEEGVSCFGTPFELYDYINDEAWNLDEADIVLFVGDRIGKGLDAEDIVEVEENAVKHFTSLRNFYKFTIENSDYVEYDRWGTEWKFKYANIEDFHPNFIKELYETEEVA